MDDTGLTIEDVDTEQAAGGIEEKIQERRSRALIFGVYDPDLE